MKRPPATQEIKEDYLDKITAVQAEENLKVKDPRNLKRLLSQPNMFEVCKV